MDDEKSIRLHAPYLTWNEDGSLCRYNVEITEDGKLLKYFAEVEKEYAEYFCTEVLDAVVLMSLTRAFRLGYDIYCDIPVTAQLLHNINEILIPHLALGDSKIRADIKVHAPATTEEFGGRGVGTAVSCGVDSLYSIMQGTDGKYPDLQLTHLFVASVNLELWGKNPKNLVEWEQSHQTAFDRFHKVSQMTKLPLIKMFSNIYMYTLFNGKQRLSRSISYICVGHALLLKKLWKAYFYASDFDFRRFSLEGNLDEDTAFYDLLTCHVLTVPGFSLFSGGGRYRSRRQNFGAYSICACPADFASVSQNRRKKLYRTGVQQVHESPVGVGLL